MSALRKTGVNSDFEDTCCNLLDEDGAFGHGDEIDRVHRVHAKPRGQDSPIMMCSAKSSKTLELWHKRLGHLNKGTLKRMISEKIVEGLDMNVKTDDTPICGPCQVGKQTRNSFPGHFNRDVSNGEVTHSDLCGPIAVTSCGGARYFVTFIDQHSRFVTAIPLKKKSDVLDEFAKFRIK